jgi:HTH-type transcriptional regulator/antitoxin HigA
LHALRVFKRVRVQRRVFTLTPNITEHIMLEVTMMDIKPIKTGADYRAALKEIEMLMTADPDTPEGEKLDVLVTLVEAYEQKHYPLDLPDPVEAIKFEMEQKGLTVKDLEPMIGKSNRVYEVLNHKRSLTLKMIWRLHEQLGIPAESLIKQSS